MNLAQPTWLFAMLLAPVVAMLALRSLWTRQAAWEALLNGEWLDRVLPASLRRRRLWGLVWMTLGLGLVALAIAEPRYGKEVREVEREGIDLVVAVDLSRSMEAQDVKPSRLERARRELVDLVQMLDGDRIGLVIYAGGAYGRMPLTLDYDAFNLLVRELDTGTFSAQGSALGEAIRTSVDLLGEDEGTGRAVLLVSDGEVHDVADAMAAAKEALDAGVRIYGLGIGQEAAPIPLDDGRFLIWRGETVMTTPSADILQDVARVTGGAYVQSTPSMDDMRRLYTSEIRRSLEARATGSQLRESWKSAFPIPLGLGMLAFLLGVLLMENRRAVALLLALLVSTSAHADTLAEGDAAYRAKRYDEAIEVFRELAMSEPDNPEIWERLGAARYRAEQFEEAARALDRAVELGGDTDVSFSAGNAHYRAGRLDEALERYDQVLEVQPDHPGATRNRAILERELEQRLLEDPPPPPEPESGDQGEQDQGDEEQQEGSDSQQGTEDGEPEDSQTQGPQGEGQQGSDADKGSEGETSQGQGSGEPAEQDSEGGGASQSDGTDRSGEQAQEPGDETEGSEEGLDDLEGLEASEGEGEGGAAGAAEGAAPEEGPMTPGQAERLLEGVEEGRPRVRIPGGGSERPW